MSEIESSLTELSQAKALIEASQVVDLHIDSFIWNRIFGYDIHESHSPFLGGRFMGQVDLPRLKEAGIRGALWSITTNPFRTALSRARTFEKNVQHLIQMLDQNPKAMALISSSHDAKLAMLNKQHAVWMCVQGGNAFGKDLNLVEKYAKKLTSVTVMHLLHSNLGTSCTPYPSFRERGLTPFGKELIEKLNEHRVFVDLAHCDRKTFMDAVSVHDKTQPLLVSHTGVKGVYDHWRNIDDEQLKCVADTGGVIGVIYEARFLGPGKAGDDLEPVVKHLEHIRKVAGVDATALGSDWDGMITPPKGLRSCSDLPNLVEVMLNRNWTSSQIEKTLGQNFLRAFAELRPDS